MMETDGTLISYTYQATRSQHFLADLVFAENCRESHRVEGLMGQRCARAQEMQHTDYRFRSLNKNDSIL